MLTADRVKQIWELLLAIPHVRRIRFATDPEYSGNNLSLVLLREMEKDMNKRGMKTLYTIARYFSPGMNITFTKQNYSYSGTLVNSTNIFGEIESMNVWYKSVG